jgi:pimeloyl-ACP methyl ester carboxylesterase
VNYFLLPGNPPALHFYESWKKEILQKFPQARVQVAAYPSVAFSHDSALIMQQVLAAHLRSLEEFCGSSSRPATLIGHSLGGYFALKLSEERPELIKKAILIQPFLRAPTVRGQWILNLMKAIHPLESLKFGAVRYRKILEMFSNNLPFVSDEEIIKTFHLAAHEQTVIGQDHSPLLLGAELCRKIRVFYSANDTWCSPAVVAQLRGQVPIRECTEPHDFITQSHHRTSLFNRINELD